MLTPYQKHVAEWRDCTRCELSTVRSRVVLARGKIPCDVLLTGESPGRSEDILGSPFVGPAGHLLDRIVELSIGDRHRVAFTNIVACLPLMAGGKTEPSGEAIRSCMPRLREFIGLAKPRLIVCVGSLAKKWLAWGGNRKTRPALEGYDGGMVSILHPAAILRLAVIQRGLEIQRCVVTIADAVEELEELRA